MAAIAPNVLFPNAELVAANGTVTAQSLCIPLSDLAGLTAAEADPSTGDGREVARIVFDTIITKVNALATANKPSKMSVSKPNPTGIGADSVRQSYTATFDVSYDSTGLAMIAEA